MGIGAVVCVTFSPGQLSPSLSAKRGRGRTGLVRLSSRHGSSVPERWERGPADQSQAAGRDAGCCLTRLLGAGSWSVPRPAQSLRFVCFTQQLSNYSWATDSRLLLRIRVRGSWGEETRPGKQEEMLGKYSKGRNSLNTATLH